MNIVQDVSQFVDAAVGVVSVAGDNFTLESRLSVLNELRDACVRRINLFFDGSIKLAVKSHLGEVEPADVKVEDTAYDDFESVWEAFLRRRNDQKCKRDFA